MAKKNSYNPFKMWGSYAGGIIYLIPLFLANTCTKGFECLKYLSPYTAIFNVLSKVNIYLQSQIIAGIIIFIVGFLIGWGIHSLIRRYK